MIVIGMVVNNSKLVQFSIFH